MQTGTLHLHQNFQAEFVVKVEHPLNQNDIPCVEIVMTKLTPKEIASHTLQIIDSKKYTFEDQEIDLSIPLLEMSNGTVNYEPTATVPTHQKPRFDETKFELHNESTLVTLQRLAFEQINSAHNQKLPCVLNFASAKNPGGGFIRGAVAQEEVLCRSSALYESIRHSPMYAFHARKPNPFYSDYAIYSPAVPYFKNDHGETVLPYYAAVVTCPAVNAGVVAEQYGMEQEKIESAMMQRIERVLSIMAHHEHDTLVLGAWGCGVFRNDPEMIARLFINAIAVHFRGVFQRVIFAVLDKTAGQENYSAFVKYVGKN